MHWLQIWHGIVNYMLHFVLLVRILPEYFGQLYWHNVTVDCWYWCLLSIYLTSPHVTRSPGIFAYYKWSRPAQPGNEARRLPHPVCNGSLFWSWSAFLVCHLVLKYHLSTIYGHLTLSGGHTPWESQMWPLTVVWQGLYASKRSGYGDDIAVRFTQQLLMWQHWRASSLRFI